MTKIVAQIALLMCCVFSAYADAAVAVKGTRVTLEPPAGFAVADRFPGFMSEETGASVMITELPAPFAEASKGFNAAGFKTQGMTLLSEEKSSFGELQGALYSASQAAQGIEFLKWLAIFGDAANTYIVTAAFPKVHAEELSEKLKAAVRSAKVSGAAVDPMDAVTFRVTPAGSMKLAKVVGNMLLFTENGIFPARGIETPLFIAGASITQSMSVPDQRLFAETRLRQVKALKEITPKETNPFEVAGLKGFESKADALDAGTSAKAVLYQVIVYDTDGYFLMQGIAAEASRDLVMPVFKEMARSFTQVKKAK